MSCPCLVHLSEALPILGSGGAEVRPPLAELWFIGGSHEFLSQGASMDARMRMSYYATGITSAMARKMVSAGSQDAVVFRDADGKRSLQRTCRRR